MGNLALIQASLGSAGNQHPRENLRAIGLLGAANAEVVLVCDGCSSFGLDLRDTFNLTLEVSGTIDGINWTLIPVLPINQAGKSCLAAVAGSTTGVWVGNCAPYWKIRARCTAYTSGAAQVTISASNGILIAEGITPSTVTILGAAGAATTLTLPSPGVGLRQYINSIRVDKFAVAALTAASAPIAITTSNLPGSLAFSIGAEGAGQGVLTTPVNIEFSRPLAASAQNGATTIVAPAITNVIWRITAGYFVAP
jgi:hypothetical protein